MNVFTLSTLVCYIQQNFGSNLALDILTIINYNLLPIMCTIHLDFEVKPIDLEIEIIR